MVSYNVACDVIEMDDGTHGVEITISNLSLDLAHRIGAALEQPIKTAILDALKQDHADLVVVPGKRRGEVVQ